MKPSSHRHHFPAAYASENQLAGMPGYRGFRETRDRRIREGNCRFDLFGKSSQAAAEDNAHPWPVTGLLPDIITGMINFLYHFFHSNHFDFPAIISFSI